MKAKDEKSRDLLFVLLFRNFAFARLFAAGYLIILLCPTYIGHQTSLDDAWQGETLLVLYTLTWNHAYISGGFFFPFFFSFPSEKMKCLSERPGTHRTNCRSPLLLDGMGSST